jgi:hypothetical protein
MATIRAIFTKLQSLIGHSRLPIHVEESELSLMVGGFFVDLDDTPQVKNARFQNMQSQPASSMMAQAVLVNHKESINYQLSTPPPIIHAMLDEQTLFSYELNGSASEIAWTIFNDIERMYIDGVHTGSCSQ